MYKAAFAKLIKIERSNCKLQAHLKMIKEIITDYEKLSGRSDEIFDMRKENI